MSKLLKENCLLEKQQVIKEGNRVKVSGIFQRADMPNKNGRVYTKGLWESILKRDEVKGMLESRNMLGELDHPDVTETSLKNVSHIVTKLEMNGSNEIIGEAEILDTPNGLILQKLLEAGVKVGISSRGYVTDDSKSKTTKEGHYQVPESFVLKTFDFVVDPSTPGAFPGVVNESVKQEILSLVESAGDNVSSHIKAVCESLNTDSGKDEDEMRIAQLEAELAKRDQTILALEGSYKSIYIENTNLKTDIQLLKNASLPTNEEDGKLKAAIEIIEGLRDLTLEKDGKLQEATDLVKGLMERAQTAENLLEAAIETAEERLNLSVEVIENLRDRYLAAEGIVSDLQDDNKLIESKVEGLNAKIAKYESKEQLESFIVEKAKELNMNESFVRDSVKQATTVEEAKDLLLSAKSHIARHSRTLPVGPSVQQTNEGTKPQKASVNKLATAISRMR